jgi:hypothetical protein
MRADFQDALAAVNWADAQIPFLQERFLAWQRNSPYRIIVEADPKTPDRELIVAYPDKPLDPLIVGDVGAIINSTRSALDIAMSAMLAAHGKKPCRAAHFPIRTVQADFVAQIAVFKSKQWASAAEIAAIEATGAYEGGDGLLYPLHQLDIQRKHERLVSAQPIVAKATITAWGGGLEPVLIRENDKTILFSAPKGHFTPTKGNNNVTSEIVLNEASLGITNQPAIHLLRQYIGRVTDILTKFPGG